MSSGSAELRKLLKLLKDGRLGGKFSWYIDPSVIEDVDGVELPGKFFVQKRDTAIGHGWGVIFVRDMVK